MSTAPTAKGYSTSAIHQGPGDLWIIGGGVADSTTPQLTLDLPGGPAMGVEEIDGPLGELDGFLPAVCRGVAERDVTPVPQAGDNLAGPLPRNAELSADLRDRGPGRPPADSQDPPVWEAAVAEACRG